MSHPPQATPRKYVGPIEQVQRTDNGVLFIARMSEAGPDAQDTNVYEIRFTELLLPASQRSDIRPGTRVTCTFAPGDDPKDGVESLRRARVRIEGKMAREDLFAAIGRARADLSS